MLKDKAKKLTTILILGLILSIILGGLSKNILVPFIFLIIILLYLAKMGFKFKKPEKIKKVKEIKIKKIPTISSIIYLIILAIILYFFRPWIHELVMALYTRPSLIALVVFIALGAWFFKLKKNILVSIFAILAALSFLVLTFNMIIVQNYIVQDTTYNNIDALPDSTDARILPRAVARRYLEDSLQKSREKIGQLNIVNLKGKLMWTAPRVPDGFVLYFTQKVNGLMTADATNSGRKTSLISKVLQIGEDIGISDNVYWRLYKKRYFIDIGDIYYLFENETVFTVAPVIAYKFKFPVMIPYYAGVFVLSQEGKIGFYKPEQILTIKQFKNNRAYPEELARLYVDSYKYHLGVLNTWFFHKDQIEISDVYGQLNKQPFLMPTIQGLKWIIATEPYGESYGVFKIFLVDALTGKINMLELNEDQTLTGPVKVVSYVKKKFPRIDWATAKVVEPRPYVINGNLYWLLSITPYDFAGISYTVFVNSVDNDVIAFEKDNDVYNFIKEGVVEEEKLEEEEEEEIVSKEEKREKLIKEIEEKLEELKKLS